MKRYAFITLGCKVNQYETQLMREQITVNNMETVNFDQKADIYVINTCTVTSTADRKSRNLISQAFRKNPEAKIVVTGCYAQRAPESLSQFKGVTCVNGDKQKVLSHLGLDRKDKITYIQNFSEHTRAFVKIQDGCDAFCSYCIVPLVRPWVTSRPTNEIITEIKCLVKNGCKEIVLTGVRLGKYNNNGLTFVDLVKLILEQTELERLRFSSIEPQEISDEFLELYQHHKKLCPHLHIPLQSGDDFILQQMRRSYTVEIYEELIKKIRKFVPNIAITTDVMVGFPQETEKHFQNSYNFIERIGFSRLHVFTYSVRPQTLAAKLQPQVEPAVKKKRYQQLIKLRDKLINNYAQKFLNKNLIALIEDKRNIITGLTGNYLRVILEQNKANLQNSLVKIEVTKIIDNKIYGKVVDKT